MSDVELADIEPRAVTLHLTAYEAYLLDAAAVTGYRALRDEAAPRAREVFPGVLDRLATEIAAAKTLDAQVHATATGGQPHTSPAGDSAPRTGRGPQHLRLLKGPVHDET